MANPNESGLSQEQISDARMEEMQVKLRDQGADMAQLKEQIAGMAKMMESMANMMQASVNAAAATAPVPAVGEGPVGQGVPTSGRTNSAPTMPWGFSPDFVPTQGGPSNLPISSEAPFVPASGSDSGRATEGRNQNMTAATTIPIVNLARGSPSATADARPVGGTGTTTGDHGGATAQKGPQGYTMDLSDYEPEEKVPSWKDEIEKLYLQIKALQSNHEQKFTSNVDDLCVFPRVEVPSRFKIPDFVKFDGTTNPEHHLRAYCSIMGNWSRDENFFLAYFHTSLAGAAYTWYMKLDRATVST